MTTSLSTYATSLAAHPYNGGFHWWFPLFPLTFFLCWVAFIVIARRLWWRGGAGPWSHAHGAVQSAEGLLAQRYAAGEIDEREYRNRLEVLRSTPPDRR